MKLFKFLFSLMTFAIIGFRAFAEDYVQPDLPPPPPLSSYIAYKSPKPPINEMVRNNFYYLSGWYVTVLGDYSIIKVNGISNTTDSSQSLAGVDIANREFSANQFNPGVAIGYQLRRSGLLSRAEISYMPRTRFNYNANPLLNPLDPSLVGVATSFSGSGSIHPILLKLYNDFYFDFPLIPYIQVGAGVTFNHTSSDSTITLGLPPGPFLNIPGSGSTTNTQFAWDAGLGLRWQLAPPFYLSGGYELDGLGKATWDVNFPSNSQSLQMESNYIYSNTFTIGLTWMPIPKPSPT